MSAESGYDGQTPAEQPNPNPNRAEVSDLGEAGDDGGANTDPARALLERLRGGSATRPPRTAKRSRRSRPAAVHPDDQAWSPAGAGDRDPALLASSVDGVVETEGWRRTLDAASLEPRWAVIVGPALAEHARPEKLVAGELTIRASSTAWATQIRLMCRQLLATIASEVGTDVVTRIHVVGPTGPSWSHGPLKIKGRGTRDTYG